MTDIGPDGTSVQETAGREGLMNPALKAGLGLLDGQARLDFTLYRRVVLPLDGFVFWVRADLLSQSALPNASAVNRFGPNQGQTIVTPAPVQSIPGSLHHTTLNQQDEAESFSLQKFRFSTPQPVDVLTAIAPNEFWIGDWKGLRLAFSSRSGFYEQAGMYHYAGDALYPALASQVIDYPDQLNARDLVVSNSLPIWLGLNAFFPLYPSYLVPDNVEPLYAAVHIGEDDTTELGAAPLHDAFSTRTQLVKDRVKVTLYGVRNDIALDWMDAVNSFTLANPTVMGLMRLPAVRDAKRGQTEFGILAQKKVVTFEVNYYQTRVNDIARQLIKNAFINFIYNPFYPPPPVPDSRAFRVGFSQAGGSDLIA